MSHPKPPKAASELAGYHQYVASTHRLLSSYFRG